MKGADVDSFSGQTFAFIDCHVTLCTETAVPELRTDTGSAVPELRTDGERGSLPRYVGRGCSPVDSSDKQML